MHSRGTKKSWNKKAGAAGPFKEHRGQHTRGRYKEGSWWAECQRCGLDVPGETLREDGYTDGLLVCTGCYDPPHPQDFVRALKDQISPSGHVTGESGLGGGTDIEGTSTDWVDPIAAAFGGEGGGAEGSTDNPQVTDAFAQPDGVVTEGSSTT